MAKVETPVILFQEAGTDGVFYRDMNFVELESKELVNQIIKLKEENKGEK